MKTFPSVIVLICLVSSTTAWGQNYLLTINGTEQAIDLDQPTTLQLADGTSIEVLLRQKEFLRYRGDLFSFECKNLLKPSTTDLGDGIKQTMVVSPLGTGVIVQEYSSINPSYLIDLMLKQLTQEEVGVGYKYEEAAIDRKVGDISLTGKQAVTTADDEEWTRCVLAGGNEKKGVLIVTFAEKDNQEADKGIIDHFWKSLELDGSLKPAE